MEDIFLGLRFRFSVKQCPARELGMQKGHTQTEIIFLIIIIIIKKRVLLDRAATAPAFRLAADKCSQEDNQTSNTYGERQWTNGIAVSQ